METPQEAVLRMMPSQPPCNQVSSALLCKCGFSCDCWTTCRLPLTGFASKCEFLCDRWITMPIDSIEPCLTALSLACCPGGFRNGRGTFYDASPAIEQAYAARCAICCPGHAAHLWAFWSRWTNALLTATVQPTFGGCFHYQYSWKRTATASRQS